MDVSFLEPVFTAPGPYATVLADVTHTTENADTELELRVRGLTEHLSEQGAPEEVVTAVRDRLLQGTDDGEAGTMRGRAVVVSADGRVLLDERLGDTPRREAAEWSAHPDLLPVLRALPGRVPHVVVLADRIGADITVASLPGHPDYEDTVEGDSFQVRKVKVGGWAHHRYQHNAEDKWIHNVDAIASDIDSLVKRLHPAFVLVAGDVRARQILSDRASEQLSERLVTMEEGGRAAGADREVIERRAEELVAENEAHEVARVLEQVEAASAHGLSVTGVPLVVEALRKGQVETLVLADEQDEGTELFVGGSPLELGVERADLQALGSQEVHPVPVGGALLAAAAASSAAVTVVPRSALPGDIPAAAVLRYTDASTPGPQRTAEDTP